MEYTEEELERIRIAEENLREFLKERPDLQFLQDKIDDMLDKVGDNQYERCRVLEEVMLNQWNEIIEAWTNPEIYKKKQDRKKLKESFKIVEDEE